MSKMRVPRPVFGALLGVSLVAGTIAPAGAETQPSLASSRLVAQAEDALDAELIGYTVDAEPMTDAEWIDPVTQFDLDPAMLAPLPEFDVAEFHDSTVFAAGVDQVETDADNTAQGVELDKHVERHRRLLQAIDTLDQLVATNATEIASRTPRVAQLVDAIDHEITNEERLADEISLRKLAIAEYAVRSFIDQDDVAEALSIPQTGLSATRVVTDEIREDQFAQINARESELARRVQRRQGLESNLSTLRSELRVLRRERTEMLDHRRIALDLPQRTESAYKLALHERLPQFVSNTDIPLVALNAYVIAERRLAEERPGCRIEWWMLAGIGKIESFHGHFGKSTLNVNGHTTEAIRGPALDGRILSGAEFVADGAVAPAATNRTEEQAVTPATPAPAPAAAPAADAPAALASADPAVAGEDGAVAAAPAPVPVIKRLALIRDSDGGRLDGDTTYDRAVGPMQFIPSTWRLYEADGNADDKSDPQNMYDAALASARYLCAATGTMATAEGRKVAYFAYNHDEEYTANVSAAGDRYREAIDIPTEEFGITSPLGIGDPEPAELRQEAAQKLAALKDLPVLDW